MHVFMVLFPLQLNDDFDLTSNTLMNTPSRTNLYQANFSIICHLKEFEFTSPRYEGICLHSLSKCEGAISFIDCQQKFFAGLFLRLVQRQI